MIDLLVYVALAFTLSVVVYFIAKLGTKEISFEEALAGQTDKGLTSSRSKSGKSVKNVKAPKKNKPREADKRSPTVKTKEQPMMKQEKSKKNKLAIDSAERNEDDHLLQNYWTFNEDTEMRNTPQHVVKSSKVKTHMKSAEKVPQLQNKDEIVRNLLLQLLPPLSDQKQAANAIKNAAKIQSVKQESLLTKMKMDSHDSLKVASHTGKKSGQTKEKMTIKMQQQKQELLAVQVSTTKNDNQPPAKSNKIKNEVSKKPNEAVENIPSKKKVPQTTPTNIGQKITESKKKNVTQSIVEAKHDIMKSSSPVKKIAETTENKPIKKQASQNQIPVISGSKKPESQKKKNDTQSAKLGVTKSILPAKKTVETVENKPSKRQNTVSIGQKNAEDTVSVGQKKTENKKKNVTQAIVATKQNAVKSPAKKATETTDDLPIKKQSSQSQIPVGIGQKKTEVKKSGVDVEGVPNNNRDDVKSSPSGKKQPAVNKSSEATKQKNKTNEEPKKGTATTNAPAVKKQVTQLQASSVIKQKSNEPPASPGNTKEKMKVISAAPMQTNTNERKKKSDKKDKSKVTLTGSELDLLMPVIRRTRLNSAEIQVVIDILLNKQHLGQGNSDWVEMGRIDPITQLKRQLEETETKLREQSETHSGLSAKILNLRTELNSERSKCIVFKKQLDNASSVMDQKLFANTAAHNDQLKLKLNELHATLDQKYQEKRMQHQQAAKLEIEKHQQQLNTVQAELENQLQQYRIAQSNMDKELQNSRGTTAEFEQQQQQLKAALSETQKQLQTTGQNRDEMLQTCQQYQQHLANLKEKYTQQESSFTSQMGDLQSKLNIAESSRSQTVSQYTQVATEREQLKKQVSNLENITDLFSQAQSKLQSTARDKNELEGRLHQSENELSSIREVLKNQLIQIELLREEKESLASQSVRPAAEGQENGDVHTEQSEPIVDDHLNSIYEEKLSSLTKEITKLKDDVSTQKKKNDELRTKNWKVLEALNTTEDLLKTRILQQDEESRRWEEEFSKNKAIIRGHFPEFVSGDSWAPSAVLSQVKTALDRKPEVIEKVIEKIVEDPKLKQMVTNLKQENAKILQKVQSLEEEKALLIAKIEAIPTALPTEAQSDPKLTELEEENKTLCEKVTHYQSVLDYTESLLKSLQASVESEESTWAGKIAEKDAKIEKISSEKEKLSLRLDEMEASISGSKSPLEMEEELNNLKEQLQKEEREKQSLTDQIRDFIGTSNLDEQKKSPTHTQGVTNANGATNGVDCNDAQPSGQVMLD